MASGSEAEKSPEVVLEWPKKDKKRLLHAVYRVGDLDRTIKCYTECFGMKLLRKRDVPEEKYTNAFLGFGPEDTNFALELTYNYVLISTTLEQDLGISLLQLRTCTNWLRKLNPVVAARSLVDLVLSREDPL